jgi:hypothetical protein
MVFRRTFILAREQQVGDHNQHSANEVWWVAAAIRDCRNAVRCSEFYSQRVSAGAHGETPTGYMQWGTKLVRRMLHRLRNSAYVTQTLLHMWHS